MKRLEENIVVGEIESGSVKWEWKMEEESGAVDGRIVVCISIVDCIL